MALDKEQLLDAIEVVLEEVSVEIMRAHAKHGDESMVSPGHDVGKQLGILMEEVGEVAEINTVILIAIRQSLLTESVGRVARATTYDNGNAANKREELIQTAAMAVSWVIADELAK